MPKWSQEQDDILRRFGSYGPEECARIIWLQFGVRRTPEAVRRHAYRIGASVIEFRICVGCGRKVTASRLSRDGLCRTCHTKKLSEEFKSRNRILRAEIDEDDEEEYARAARDYAKHRQQASRTRRKLGLSREE